MCCWINCVQFSDIISDGKWTIGKCKSIGVWRVYGRSKARSKIAQAVYRVSVER